MICGLSGFTQGVTGAGSLEPKPDTMSDEDDYSDDDFLDASPVAKQNGKKLSIERIYQKKTQLEHILLRPDTYIGSVEMETKVRAKCFYWLSLIQLIISF